MKWILFFLVIYLVQISSGEATSTEADAKIIGGNNPKTRRAGPINEKTDKKALENIFGKIFLKDVSESPGEEMTPEEKTIISKPKFQGFVTWNTDSQPAGQKIQSFCANMQDSIWEVEKIKVGSGISELEKLNSGPFTFVGFASDSSLSGLIDSKQGSPINDLKSKGITFRLQAGNKSAKEFKSFDTDKASIKSDTTGIDNVKISVSEICVYF